MRAVLSSYQPNVTRMSLTQACWTCYDDATRKPLPWNLGFSKCRRRLLVRQSVKPGRRRPFGGTARNRDKRRKESGYRERKRETRRPDSGVRIAFSSPDERTDGRTATRPVPSRPVAAMVINTGNLSTTVEPGHRPLWNGATGMLINGGPLARY